MNTQRNRLLLVLLAFLAVSAPRLHAVDTPPPESTFFTGASFLGDDADGSPVYYLSYFDTFTIDPTDNDYVYKYSFGWLYNLGGTTDLSDDVYLYDFDTDDFLYTAEDLYPYFYSFNLNTYLFYYEGSEPREFYNFALDDFYYYPPLAQ